MLFSNEDRVIYDRSPLHEVICQIRFPDILAIEAKEPADFQEAIRADFPRYLLKKDQPAPKITGFVDGAPQVDRPAPVSNYHFVSADNMWKLNLTRNFIALSAKAPFRKAEQEVRSAVRSNQIPSQRPTARTNPDRPSKAPSHSATERHPPAQAKTVPVSVRVMADPLAIQDPPELRNRSEIWRSPPRFPKE